MTMKIVFTDAKIIDRGDMDWKCLEKKGDLTIYPDMKKEDAANLLCDAEAVFVDGFEIDREVIEAAVGLKFIGVAATGYNNIDTDFAKERGIAVCNVPAYSTEAVAQHTMALLLNLAGHIGDYDREVREGRWNSKGGATYEPFPITLLDGRSIGIIGYGNIGRKVGTMAEAMGMKVNVYSRDARACISSDVISLHCPLTDDTYGLVNDKFISRMKTGAILINTARGGLVDGHAVAAALKSGKLAAYGCDVTSPEPPADDDPLFDAPNCIITPHVAFSPVEVRQRVIDICGENLSSFLEGSDLNRIV